ncbi:MAG: methyltransferase [Anaerolineales bacterium]|nr:methyltransferase [Anaerolineales bacterium]
MNSRERIMAALNQQGPDLVPLDLGASPVTGMHVQTVYKLRQALGLDPPGTPVKVIEPYQSLGEIEPDLIDALGVDVVGVSPPCTLFGFKNEDWKEWEYFDGTPLLVPGDYNTVPESNGDILMYPEGDRSVQPSGRMPAGGWYFDAIIRQPPIHDSQLRVDDNLEEFSEISEKDLAYFKTEIEHHFFETDKAILANFGGTAFGDIALVPATWLEEPKGIRDVEEWYISTVSRREYIFQVFERQCEIALANLEKIHKAVGDSVAAIYMSGTDFGTQRGPFLSRQTFRELYMPHQKKLNDWVHENTSWKTFMHSCGSTRALIPDFIDAGFDILNPVQWTADSMDPQELKSSFGGQVTFWGGGVDTQRTLPFGTPEEVREEVQRNLEVFRSEGGFVFNTIHNVQPNVPIENVLAMYEAFREYRAY